VKIILGNTMFLDNYEFIWPGWNEPIWQEDLVNPGQGLCGELNPDDA